MREVIFRGRYLHTIIEDLPIAIGGGEIVPNRQCSYTDDDLLPHCCLCRGSGANCGEEWPALVAFVGGRRRVDPVGR